MDPITTLGKIIGDDQRRDAIHIAIAPMEAAVGLKPGQHVGTDGHGRIAASEPHIGIVDPFLRRQVKAGERCWIMLYPNTITALRHEWAHPAFREEAAPRVGNSDSERWMRAWAMEHMSADYYGEGDSIRSEDDAYKSAIEAGHQMSVGPYESARDYIDSEWWSHWEIITGRRGQRGEYFSCAC